MVVAVVDVCGLEQSVAAAVCVGTRRVQQRIPGHSCIVGEALALSDVRDQF